MTRPNMKRSYQRRIQYFRKTYYYSIVLSCIAPVKLAIHIGLYICTLCVYSVLLWIPPVSLNYYILKLKTNTGIIERSTMYIYVHSMCMYTQKTHPSFPLTKCLAIAAAAVLLYNYLVLLATTIPHPLQLRPD